MVSHLQWCRHYFFKNPFLIQRYSIAEIALCSPANHKHAFIFHDFRNSFSSNSPGQMKPRYCKHLKHLVDFEEYNLIGTVILHRSLPATPILCRKNIFHHKKPISSRITIVYLTFRDVPLLHENCLNSYIFS